MKQAILYFLSLLPDRLWHTILRIFLKNERLVDLYGMHYLSELASRLHVARVSVLGEYRIFSTAPNDSVVLK
jgi:hypothetical protein